MCFYHFVINLIYLLFHSLDSILILISRNYFFLPPPPNHVLIFFLFLKSCHFKKYSTCIKLTFLNLNANHQLNIFYFYIGLFLDRNKFFLCCLFYKKKFLFICKPPNKMIQKSNWFIYDHFFSIKIKISRI